MPSYVITTVQRAYPAIVERGALNRLSDYFPPKSGKVFVVTTADVWQYHATRLALGLVRRSHEIILYPGGEERKRLETLETMAEEMVHRGADRSSVIVAFGGGIVNDVAGFLAAIFMRGIPVIQLPTTLLAQVDASIGGKTGVNLASGKNLVGSFHQPLAVLIEPEVLGTLPGREYRAGLFEVIKYGVIRSPELFELLASRREQVLAREPEIVERMIAECVRIKAEVVSADEREGDLRRILNFGHTVGHALEAETGYSRFLHGEAVGIGMKAAVELSRHTGLLHHEEAARILALIEQYGPVPSLEGVTADALAGRLRKDKKTIAGKVHFVLPEKIGEVKIVSGIEDTLVRSAVQAALA